MKKPKNGGSLKSLVNKTWQGIKSVGTTIQQAHLLSNMAGSIPEYGKFIQPLVKSVGFGKGRKKGGCNSCGTGKKQMCLSVGHKNDGRHPEMPRKAMGKGRGKRGTGFFANILGGIAGLLSSEFVTPIGGVAVGSAVSSGLSSIGLGRKRGRRGTGVTTHPSVSSSGFAKI
jgi:hypothetical protein